MLNNKNLVILQGNLTRDAELKDEHGLLIFSIASDWSGQEKGSDNRAGYFEVKSWVNNSGPVGDQMKEAFNGGKLVKGAAVNIIGRLNQERWKTEDGKTASRVVVVAETINIMWSGEKNADDADKPAAAAAPAANFLESF